MKRLPLISQQCETFKLEYGKLGASWTTWSFETFYSEASLLARVKTLQAGMFMNVWGFDILNNDWISLGRKPILKRVK